MDNEGGRGQGRQTTAEGRQARHPTSARCRYGTWPTSIPDPKSKAVAGRSGEGRRRGAAHQAALPGQARRARPRRRRAGGGDRRLREPERHHRQARLLRGPALRRRHRQPGERQVLRRHPGEDHRHHHRPHLLRARAQQDRGRRPRQSRCRCRRSPATSRGSTTCARRSPISSTSSSNACSTRRRSPSRGSWSRLFSETMTALRFEVAGETEPLALEPTLNFLMHPDGRKRQAAAEALAKRVQGQHPPVHAHHQHARQGQGDLRPLARLQGRGRQPPSRQPRRARGGRCAGRGRARRLSPHRAPLLRHEGPVARPGQARLLGPQRAAARAARARRSLGRSAAHGARRLRRLRAGDGEDRQALLRRRLDRRAGARGQVARRLLAPDRALGAPLHPDELPGQAARRHDAGARAGPRRAPGAGGARSGRCWRRRR